MRRDNLVKKVKEDKFNFWRTEFEVNLMDEIGLVEYQWSINVEKVKNESNKRIFIG